MGGMMSGLLKSDFRSKICHSADIRVGLLVEELGTDEGLGCSAVASVARLQVRGKFRAHESLSRVLACSYCGLYLKLWREPIPVHTQFAAGFGLSGGVALDPLSETNPAVAPNRRHAPDTHIRATSLTTATPV